MVYCRKAWASFTSYFSLLAGVLACINQELKKDVQHGRKQKDQTCERRSIGICIYSLAGATRNQIAQSIDMAPRSYDSRNHLLSIRTRHRFPIIPSNFSSSALNAPSVVSACGPCTNNESMTFVLGLEGCSIAACILPAAGPASIGAFTVLIRKPSGRALLLP